MKISPRNNQIIARYPNMRSIGRKDVFQKIMAIGDHFKQNFEYLKIYLFVFSTKKLMS